jgi:uncharacterized membrane protein YgaE (UPF0421/DUF939 family)
MLRHRIRIVLTVVAAIAAVVFAALNGSGPWGP